MTKPEAKPANPAEEAQEQVETEQEEDFAGYGSLEKLKEATYASRREGKRMAKELAETKALVAAALQRDTPKERTSALDEIEKLGLPKDLLTRAVNELVDPRIDEKVESKTGPDRAINAAVASLRADDEGFRKFEGDFNEWLQDNPEAADEYIQDVKAHPKAARGLLRDLFAEYAKEKRVSVRKTIRAEDEDEGGGGGRVGGDARTPGNRSKGGGRSTPKGPNKEEMDEIIRDARRTGQLGGVLRAALEKHGASMHPEIEKLRQR